MDNVVRNALQNFVSTRTDIFGESQYEGFDDESLNIIPDGYNSTQVYGRVIYRDKSGKICKSESIILKLMPEIKNSKFVSFSFINEMNFYSKIIPALGTLDASICSFLPQFMYGEMIYNITGDQTVLIVENLKNTGYQLSEKKSFLDLDHLTLMVRRLGQFHAYSYQAREKIPNLFYPLANAHLEANFFANLEVHGVMAHTAERGLKSLQNEPAYEAQIKSIRGILQNAENYFVKVIKDDSKPQAVLCHGDYLRNNVLFRYENDLPVEIKLIDLATYRIASPVVDLALVLYMNADQNTRDQHWDALINEYYTALRTTFPNNENIPSKEEILSDFVGKAFYAYLVASYFLPGLIAADNGIVCTAEMPPELLQCGLHELPAEEMVKICLIEGGEKATAALSDIVKDMMDRGFIRY